MPFTEQVLYGIAPGFNASESQRINIQGYDPGVVGGSPFLSLRSYGSYSPGNLIVRADQSVYFAGFPSVQWIWSWLDYANERWAMDTFANGGYSGNVTLWTTTDTPNEIQKFNAVLRMPVLTSTQPIQPGFRDLAWIFILQEQLVFSEFLLETGFAFLLQTGDTLLLESST